MFVALRWTTQCILTAQNPGIRYVSDYISDTKLSPKAKFKTGKQSAEYSTIYQVDSLNSNFLKYEHMTLYVLLECFYLRTFVQNEAVP